MRNDYILSYPEELLGEVAYGEELDGTITVYSNGGYVGNIVPHKPLPDILPKVRYFILNDNILLSPRLNILESIYGQSVTVLQPVYKFGGPSRDSNRDSRLL